MIVKRAEIKDVIQEISDMCKLWWYDSLFYRTTGLKYDPIIDMFTGMNDSIVCIVMYEDKKLIGTYVGGLQWYPFCKHIKCCQEIVWCLHPEHRTFRNLKCLIDRIELEMAKESVSLWNLNVPAIQEFKGLCRYIEEKRGYTKLDSVYSRFKEIDNG